MNQLSTIEPIQLGDRTVEIIRKAIINGDLRPGEHLRDRQLAEQLGISRTPVREALHRLEATGLVVSRGRSGWEVSPFTEQDVHELFQLRRMFEPMALSELGKKQDESAIAEIGHFFDPYAHPIRREDYPEYFAQDNAFHNRIVACSDNARLRGMYVVLQDQVDRGRHFLTSTLPGRADDNLEEHLSIARAVALRDFDAATKHLLAHLQTGEDLMIEQLRSGSGLALH